MREQLLCAVSRSSKALVIWLLIAFGPAAAVALGQQGARVELGRLPTAAVVSFTRSAKGEWGLEIAGGSAPRILQPKPARIEVYRAANDQQQLAAGYKRIQKSGSGIDADADVAYGKDVVFRVHDTWSVASTVLSLHREVRVRGNAPGGFYSAIDFTVDPSVTWPDISFMVPGAIYGDPTYDGDRSPGGTLNYAARHLWMREDILAAPLLAMSFKNGASLAMLDPAPRGDTTEEESKLTNLVMTDGRFQFGAMGAWQAEDGAVAFGFRFPGTVEDFGGARDQPAVARSIRRYHPMTDGFTDRYQVLFRLGQNESFRDVTRDAWRWAWSTLKPPVNYIDVGQVRQVLMDHLEAQAVTLDGRTGIPFARSTVVDTPNWNWTMIGMGFVAKNLECANQLLLEGVRDPTQRGQAMRATGLAIIASMIQALHAIPLEATGYDLASGAPWDHFWLAPWLRNATEDMTVLMHAYRREPALGPHTRNGWRG